MWIRNTFFSVDVGNSFTQPCTGSAQNRMSCPAPAFSLAFPATLYIGLLMDGVCHLLDLNTTVTIYEDPFFEPFGETLLFSEADTRETNINITVEVIILLLE